MNHTGSKKQRVLVLCNLPYDFGKKMGAKKLSGVGSGSWHRFDKKTTTGETHSLDVRYLHREGLLKPGRSFSLRWSRAGRETGSIGGMVRGDHGDLPEQVVLSYRHQGGSLAGGEWEDIRELVSFAHSTSTYRCSVGDTQTRQRTCNFLA